MSIRQLQDAKARLSELLLRNKLTVEASSGGCGGLGSDEEPQVGGAAFECGDGSLPLLLFISLLALIDVVLAASEHEVDHSGKFVSDGGVGAGFVHACAHAAVEGAQRRAAARQAHGGELEGLARAIARSPGARRQNFSATDFGPRAQAPARSRSV